MKEFENNSNELELLSKNSKINSFLNLPLEEMERNYGVCAHVPVSLVETLVKFTQINSSSRESLSYDLAQKIRFVASQVRNAAEKEEILSLRKYAVEELASVMAEISIEEIIIQLKAE